MNCSSYLLIFYLLIAKSPVVLSQSYDEFTERGDSCYYAGDYTTATEYYIVASQITELNTLKKSALYNAACCLALSGETEKAIQYLEKAVYEYGYNNLNHLLNDPDFNSLHSSERWTYITDYLNGVFNRLKNPANARIITSDIHNFWEAYDLAQNNPKQEELIFRNMYFNRASIGLQDYITYKIGTLDKFLENLRNKPKFYYAIRKNTLEVDELKDEIRSMLFRFEKIYSDAFFPDIYFVIGRWNSGGTASDNGLIIAIDQMCKSEEIPLDELSLWEKNNFGEIKNLPAMIAHELVHFQQYKLPMDTTLLSASIMEGMADFIGELISGKNINERLHKFVAEKNIEQKIREEFKDEMYLNRSENWIANAEMETEERPADLGYFVGYKICKAYYDSAEDKRQAVIDMFNIKDYGDFLRKSGYIGPKYE